MGASVAYLILRVAYVSESALGTLRLVWHASRSFPPQTSPQCEVFVVVWFGLVETRLSAFKSVWRSFNR